MRRAARRLGAAAVACGALLLVAAAPAAAEARIKGLNVSEGAVRFEFSLHGGEIVGTPSPSALLVTLDGKKVSATVRPVKAGQGIERSAMLLLDTSGSMQGAGISGAVSAANAFLDGVPSDVSVGLTTFATTPDLLVAPTRNRVAVRRALGTVRAHGETSLYDGVLTALAALRGKGQGTLVLLSDGGDTTSTASVDDMLGQLRTSGVDLQVVALTTRESASGVLQRIGAARGVVPKGVHQAGDLASVFRAAASTLSEQLQVDVVVPSALAGKQTTLQVAVATRVGMVRDSVVLTVPGSAGATPLAGGRIAAPGLWAEPWMLTIALGALFVGLCVLVALALVAKFTPVDSAVQTRRLLARYTLDRKTAGVGQQASVLEQSQSSVLGQSAVARSALELAGRVVQRRGIEERTALRLDRASVPLRPAEWLLVRAGVSAASFAVFTLLSGSVLWGLLLGVLTGLAGTSGWLAWKVMRRLRAFTDGLPEALTLIAGSLSTGYSLPQSLDSVVREGSQPMAGEIGRALAAARLGVPIEDALDGVAERMDSKDFLWAVMAIRIQRDVGGNLSEVLKTASATLRERAQLRRQVSVLSAEGRLSAYVLVGLPISMALYMFTLRRDYIRPLYTQGLGIAMLSGAILLVVAGSLWMRKLVQVEV